MCHKTAQSTATNARTVDTAEYPIAMSKNCRSIPIGTIGYVNPFVIRKVFFFMHSPTLSIKSQSRSDANAKIVKAGERSDTSELSDLTGADCKVYF